MKRKAISPKVRFEVFHRDGFTCQYCGLSVPDVALELDHIEPVSKGGSDEIDNLITSCTACNRGKAAKKLTVGPVSITEKCKIIKEKQRQLKAYYKALENKTSEDEKIIDKLEEEFRTSAGLSKEEGFTQQFRNSIRRNFLDRLDYGVLRDAIHAATDKCKDPGRATVYFCGICWNKIKGRNAF